MRSLKRPPELGCTNRSDVKYFRVRLSGRAPFLVEAESADVLRKNYEKSQDKILVLTELPSLECALAKETMAGKPRSYASRMTNEELDCYRLFRQALLRLLKDKGNNVGLKELLETLEETVGTR